MKFKTIQEGEQAVILDHLGQGQHVVGPCRVFLFRKRLEKLKHFTATQYEYLALKDNDGIVTHKRGPCEIFHNPLLYNQVLVLKATKIDANHLVVVYKRLTDGSVQRRIIQGPTVFVPEAEEWLHKFKWHGADKANPSRIIPGQDQFTQLPVIPSQFYYDVKEVRTVDDTMITVKLMIFYEIKEILTMLDTTHDPIADMINAVCADIITFGGKLKFEDFLKQSSTLSDLASYPQLVQRSQRIGFQIQKVVYRGYHTSNQLQAMQNSAIESRTQLRLNTEIEEQKQKLQDFKLSKEQERTKLRQDMERSKQEHTQKIEQLKQKHQLEVTEMEHAQKMTIADQMTRARLDHKLATDEQNVFYMNSIKKLGVNLTNYLTGQLNPPVTEEIQVTEKNLPCLPPNETRL